MKLIHTTVVLTLGCILFMAPLHAQEFQWEVRADLPAGRWGASTFVIGETAYVVGGRIGSTDRTEMWAYDLQSDSWTVKASIPVGRRLAAAFVVNGKGYVSCGLTGTSTRLNDLWEYDPTTNSWSSRANFPGVARYGTYHFGIDGFGYVGAGNMGSSSGPFLADAFRYNPLTNSWSAATALPDAARHGTASFVMNGLAYVFGGKESDQAFSPDLWRYNANTDSWTLLAPFPGEPRSSPLAFVYSSDAVIGCGRNESTNFFDVWRYDPQTDLWYTVPAYPGESSLAGTSFSIAGRAFGGLGWLLSDNTSRSDLWELVKPNSIGFDEYGMSATGVRVFPVPALNATHVNFSSGSNEIVNMEVFDPQGRSIASFRFLGSHALDVGAFATGTYVARWSSGGSAGHSTFEVVAD
jgi:N-acetylneuraminic acid mutarotase